jgi:hypothetical protein
LKNFASTGDYAVSYLGTEDQSAPFVGVMFVNARGLGASSYEKFPQFYA